MDNKMKKGINKRPVFKFRASFKNKQNYKYGQRSHFKIKKVK